MTEEARPVAVFEEFYPGDSDPETRRASRLDSDSFTAWSPDGTVIEERPATDVQLAQLAAFDTLHAAPAP